MKPIRKMSWFLLAVCITSAACEAKPPPANRWEVKSRKQGITPLQRRAYQQLAELRYFMGMQPCEWDIVRYQFIAPNAMTKLRDMGIDVLPILAEALDDSTPSETVNRIKPKVDPWTGKVHVWKVNELVALLIRDITNHTFVLGEWGDGAYLLDIEAHRDPHPRISEGDSPVVQGEQEPVAGAAEDCRSPQQRAQSA